MYKRLVARGKLYARTTIFGDDFSTNYRFEVEKTTTAANDHIEQPATRLQ